MSDTPTSDTTTESAPANFGAEIAAAMAERGIEQRAFDPDASRADFETSRVAAVIGGDDADIPTLTDPLGVSTAAEGAALDSLAQLAPPTVDDVPADALPAPGVDGHPDADSSAGVAGDPPAPADEVSGELPPPTADEVASGYTWNDSTADGAPISQRFSDAEVQQGLQLRAWAQSLTDETRNVFGLIEQGQAVAIPRADYDRYLAFQQQQTRSTRDRDLENYDEDAAAEIARLRDLVSNTTAAPTAPAPIDPNVDANLTAAANQFDAAAIAWGQARGLTEDEFRGVYQSALDANIINGLSESLAQRNPVTGQLIRPADISQVAQRALDAALTWNPALSTAAATRAQSTGSPTSSPTVTPPAPSTTPTAADNAVRARRARAGSVASAPSAAAPPPRPKQLSGQDLTNAMAEELSKVMAAD